jgi:hypothetical protein
MLMPEIIIQVQGAEESLAHYSWNLACCRGGSMVKGNGLAQGINYDVAILASGDMALDLFTQFLVKDPIHIIGQGAQQGPAIGIFMEVHA